jgi:fatty acid-binding protein DegV
MTSFEEWNKTIPSFKEDYVLVILSASKDEEKINKAKEILDIINPGMEIIFRNLSLNVTAHTGPGVIGLGIMKKY